MTKATLAENGHRPLRGDLADDVDNLADVDRLLWNVATAFGPSVSAGGQAET